MRATSRRVAPSKSWEWAWQTTKWIFILEPGTDRYLGRLCNFAQCPKGNRACEVPGCGAEAFLRQHEDFVFRPDALNADRMIPLYRRGQGIIQRVVDIPRTGQEPV